MKFFDYFRTKEKSAQIAKERLQIIVAHERHSAAENDHGEHEYLPLLKNEILEVIRKYIQVDQKRVRIELDREGDYEILELNITLPDRSKNKLR